MDANSEKWKDDGHVLTEKEKKEARDRSLMESLRKTDVSDIEDDLKAQAVMQKPRKMRASTLARVKDAHLPKKRRSTVAAVPEVVENDDPYHDEIATQAARTPEVRFAKAHMLRPFNDDELKIIAAALKTDLPLYRVADNLHCSQKKVMTAINNIPVLAELAAERIERRKGEAREAVRDCVKLRVPAVVMWYAEKMIPEEFGENAGAEEEDDTKLILDVPSDEMLKLADERIAQARARLQLPETGAALDLALEERNAEMAAAGAGAPQVPLADVPPAPAVSPDPNDGRFGEYVPAYRMGRMPSALEDPSASDGFGDYGGYMDDDGGFV